MIGSLIASFSSSVFRFAFSYEFEAATVVFTATETPYLNNLHFVHRELRIPPQKLMVQKLESLTSKMVAPTMVADLCLNPS
jgi:hypothetical protein